MSFKDISYLELWGGGFCSVEQNNLFNFVRSHMRDISEKIF